MKYGLSILINEIVEAHQVEYGDCAEFQIVCPACMEPTFKKERHIEGDKISHFFSHYQAKSENQVCELRVNSMTTEQVATFNAISRGQNIEKFAESLPKIIFSHTVSNFEKGNKTLQVMESRKMIPAFKKLINAYYERFTKLSDLDGMADQAMRLILRSFERKNMKKELELYTPFYVESQLEIAKNIIKYLMTVPGRKTFDMIAPLDVAIAYTCKDNWDVDYITITDADLSKEGHEKILEEIAPLNASYKIAMKYFKDIMEGSSLKADRAYEQLKNYNKIDPPPLSIMTHNLAVGIVSDVSSNPIHRCFEDDRQGAKE